MSAWLPSEADIDHMARSRGWAARWALAGGGGPLGVRLTIDMGDATVTVRGRTSPVVCALAARVLARSEPS